jgi:hypothetical protein
MKKSLLFSILFLSTLFTRAQLLGQAGLENVYRDFMLQAHSQFSKAVANDFLSVGGEQRFESAYWMWGGATNNFGVTIEDNYQFNYDYLAHELHAKWKDTTIIVNNNYVKRFYVLVNGRPKTFVKSPVIDAAGKYFFESLGFDAADSTGYQLLKLRTIKKLKADRNSYLANFSGDYTDQLDSKYEYFVVKPDGSFTKIKLNRKGLNEAFAANKSEVNHYFSQIDEVNDETAGGLVRYINSKRSK